MISLNREVEFIHGYGLQRRKFKCLRVVFGWKIIGTIEDDVDNIFIEDYEDAWQTIRVQVYLTFVDTLWMARFLKATDKQLTFDGITVEVVNDQSNLSGEFSQFKGTTVASEIELKFTFREPGLRFEDDFESIAIVDDNFRGVR